MRMQNNIYEFNYDDILLLCGNVNQTVSHLIKEFKTLNMQEKAEVLVLFENTYVGKILRDLNKKVNTKD
jgi:hypothetical protein